MTRSSSPHILRLSAYLLVSLLVLAGSPSPGLAKQVAQSGVEKSSPAVAPGITRLNSFHFQHGGKLLRSPVAIACDPISGDLAIVSFESSEVVLFNSSGALLFRLGKQAGLNSPSGVAFDAAGRIYVSEMKLGSLKVFNPSGQLSDEMPLRDQNGRRVTPGRISLDTEGRIYLVDQRYNQALLFSAEGKLLQTQSGFNYLQKTGPAGQKRLIAISAQGTAVSRFNQDGTLLNSFGKHGDTTERNVSFPTGFAFDSRERIWLADAFQHRLKVFDVQGQLLFNYGRLEEKAGGFFFPVDLCFDSQGRLFVLEKGANRVQVFQIEDLHVDPIPK